MPDASLLMCLSCSLNSISVGPWLSNSYKQKVNDARKVSGLTTMGFFLRCVTSMKNPTLSIFKPFILGLLRFPPKKGFPFFSQVRTLIDSQCWKQSKFNVSFGSPYVSLPLIVFFIIKQVLYWGLGSKGSGSFDTWQNTSKIELTKISIYSSRYILTCRDASFGNFLSILRILQCALGCFPA